MTRIAFAADLHVDDLGSSKIDATTGWPAQFEDGIAAVEFVAEAALEREAAALVVAGDYTELRNPSPPRVSRIQQALALGPRQQVHVRGNHDSERTGHSIVDVLGARPGWHGHTVPGITVVDDVAICAIPYLPEAYLRAQDAFATAAPREIYQALRETYLGIARGLYAQAAELDVRTRILTGHQQLAGEQMNDSQATFFGDKGLVVESQKLTAIGFDAVLFGHVHRAQTIVDDPDCPVLFIGSTHRVDFAEEHEQKRFLIVDNAGGRLSIESIEIPSRRYVTVDAENIDTVPQDTFHDAVVRVVNASADADTARIRRFIESLGAFDVASIRRAQVTREAAVGAIAEDATPGQALDEYFVADPDREALVELGRRILQEARA